LALVKMMRRLSTLVGPEHRTHLTIAGDGPWRARLERAVSAAGLTREITLVGRQTREQIRTLLGCSDVFVLPTVRESFGLAALEARCAGLPVVAMRASGVSELIDHGVHGFLADSDADFAAHVERLVRDRSIRSAITEENRRSAPPFDWASVLDAQVSLYARAIELAYSHEPRAPLDVRDEHVFHAAQRHVPGLEPTVDSEAFATEIHELPRMHE
jgi:glycosyltransferase involved in cell wall biosynthesis